MKDLIFFSLLLSIGCNNKIDSQQREISKEVNDNSIHIGSVYENIIDYKDSPINVENGYFISNKLKTFLNSNSNIFEVNKYWEYTQNGYKYRVLYKK
jgi:hypothetical protein